MPGYEPSPKLHRRLQALRDSDLVDYEAVRRVKLAFFEGVFKKNNLRVRLASKALRDFAVFEALREEFGEGWQNWPEAFHHPESKAVKAFAKKNARSAWPSTRGCRGSRGRSSTARCATRTSSASPLGLYVDLALGADRGGAEVWSDQDAYALGTSVGAPPDEFNPRGQDWSLPPYSPRALRAKGFRPFIELLRANMPVGGALRMDHIMALSRLWWIPEGEKPGARRLCRLFRPRGCSDLAARAGAGTAS